MLEPYPEKWNSKCPGCSRKFRRLAFGSLLLIFLLLICMRLNSGRNQERLQKIEEPHLMLWWNECKADKAQRQIYSGRNVCQLTYDRQRLGEAKVILFYGPHITVHDLPIPRSTTQLWSLLHDGSPQDSEILLFTNFMQHFNYTSTFSRYSNFPLTLTPLSDASELIKSTYLIPFEYRHSNPVFFMENNCDTMSGRENYVRELMSYVLVYSCGNCLRNADTPKIKKESDLLSFMAQFKFVLAFEDAICDDYITSMYWNALTVGAIPIYFGAPNIKDWEPHNHSAIYISDYKSPKDLATYISYLNQNVTAFTEYLISNLPLLKGLLWRNDAYYTNKLAAFEKDICQRIHEGKTSRWKTANHTHMNCPIPQPYPSSRTEYQTKHAQQWKTKWAVTKCTAYLVNKRLRMNTSNFSTPFTNVVQGLVERGLC